MHLKSQTKVREKSQVPTSNAKERKEKEKQQEKKPERKHESVTKEPEKGDRTNVNIGNTISLRTVPVILRKGNTEVETIAMLDDGSSTSYLLEDVTHELQLEMDESITKTSLVFGNKQETYSTCKVSDFFIEDLGGENRIKLKCLWTHPVLVGNAPVIEWTKA
jgi:hypothetical protein